MAADVFESYSVTMVAAVMLGYAAFGYKGMVFPLLVQAVGVVSSMISTALVGRGITTGNSATAMHSINRGFWRSAALSTIGFMLFGAIYLRFDAAYIIERGIDCKVKVGAHGSHGSIATVTLAGLPADQREVVAGEVHTLLDPFVMRHEVVQAA